MKMLRRIALVLPSLQSGGLERVMTELAYHFALTPHVKVHIIALTRGKRFYQLPPKVSFHEPPFNHKDYARIIFTFKIFIYLRNKLKLIKPDSLLSFGGKYNSFVLLASHGLSIETFISDRSRPNISYGKFQDILNLFLYRKATGIIAQTEQAKEIINKKIKHRNVKTIGNPIRKIESNDSVKENVILNVGRFIPSKHQGLLLDYFSEVRELNWHLVFLGTGPNLENVKEKAKNLNLGNKVSFPGVVENVDDYFRKSKIFAFTSTSEGFPNVLGEAMSAGLACISYDCLAGPVDLIDDGKNGFLVPEMKHDEYIYKLTRLIQEQQLREMFGTAAKEKIKQYSREKIGEEYYQFIIS